MINDITVWVRGAGELGSATALVLHMTGFRVFLSELPVPLAIRRTVTFSDAVLAGESYVEGVKSVHTKAHSISRIFTKGHIPILMDNPEKILPLEPAILVDARMLKHRSEAIMDYTTLTIGLGPGFTAGKTCHAVVETMRGHNLGKIIWQGEALPNTKIPGNIDGETVRRVIHAPAKGILEWDADFGDLVAENDLMGTIDKRHEIKAPLGGLVRGLISPDVPVEKGLKIADIDPRGESVDYLSVSDKARAIGRGVLEVILTFLKKSKFGS